MAISLTLKVLTISISILRNDFIHKVTTSREQFDQSYDFIVVGSGTAGSAVAKRLSENARITVLCLEVGGPASLVTDLPAMGNVVISTKYNWNYTQEEQQVGLGWRYRRIREERGKVLGGTSQINSMVYNRGNRKGYDNWAKEFGAVGWAFNDVMPYFLKSENNTDWNLVRKYPWYHSNRGPVQISSVPDPDPIMRLYQKAIYEMGFPETDINGPNQFGTTFSQTFTNGTGYRSSISNAYIDPNPNPQNLHILAKAFVIKILFQERTAIGVEFIKKGHKFTVYARKEVIVCAGTINSPQLLMLSGIGPKEHLEKLSIPVLADLPVGQHYQNHMRLDIRVRIRDESLVGISKQLDNSALTVDNLYEFFHNGSGPLTQYYNTITYLNSRGNVDTDWPNIALETRLRQMSQNVSSDAAAYERQEEWTQYYRSYAGKHYLYFMPVLQRPRSYGYLRLVSTNPYVYPIFSAQYLSHPKDFEEYLEITTFMFRFIENSSLSKYLVPLKPIPGCRFCPNQRYIHECQPYMECLIREGAWSFCHDVGTCRMGDVNRDDVVVDSRLRVKGLSRVRVCDASVMPRIPNANTNAPTLMIGEKCADLIKEDNHC